MLAATLLAAGAALTQTQPAVDDAADRYIVVLEDGVENPSQVASWIEDRQDVEVGFVYSNALEGFSAKIPDEDLAAVRSDPRVDYVEPDGRVHTVAFQTLPWGIDKIEADISSTEAGNGSEMISNVNVYIIDTGIYRRHPDLNVVVPEVNFQTSPAGDTPIATATAHTSPALWRLGTTAEARSASLPARH